VSAGKWMEGKKKEKQNWQKLTSVCTPINCLANKTDTKAHKIYIMLFDIL